MKMYVEDQCRLEQCRLDQCRSTLNKGAACSLSHSLPHTPKEAAGMQSPAASFGVCGREWVGQREGGDESERETLRTHARDRERGESKREEERAYLFK